MLTTAAVVPLAVSDEAFLVKSLIERCPKTMMLRELVVNAIEAASAAQPNQSIVRVGYVVVDGTRKLRIWNTGPGLTAAELDQICNIASSIHKVVGLDGNFGMGAKVASLPSNQRGLIYRSCARGVVHQVIMGCRDGIYGRLLQKGQDGIAVAVTDVTAECRAEHNLGNDWTEVVLLGNRGEQDTAAQPYDGSPKMAAGWVTTVLTQRFFRLPPWLSLEIDSEIAGAMQRQFVPISDRTGEFTRTESVPILDGGFIHYCFMDGPPGIPDPGTPVHELRGIAGIVHRSEIYGLRTGSQWVLDGPSFGIPFGARSITVFVELAEDCPVRPEAYRQFLRTIDGDQHQVVLADYAAAVRQSIPGWLRDIIAANTPQQADYLSEVRDELKALVAELELLPEDSQTPKATTQMDEATSKLPGSPASRHFQTPPEMIALHDPAQVDDHGLNGRAAQYLPMARQLYVNMLYPGVLRMKLDLRQAFLDAPDQDRVKALATEVAEWSMLRLVARATIYSLTKEKEGWSKEEVARAQSAEALTLVADSYKIGLPAAQRRLSRLLAEGESLPDEAQAADRTVLLTLRAQQRREIELATTEQAARRGLTIASSPPGPFMRRLSEVAMRRSDLALALDWAHKAVKADGSDPWSQHHMSGLLLSTGDSEGAFVAANAALKAMGDNPHPAVLRRMAELEARRMNKDAALAWSRRAVEADRMDPWSHFGLSGALLSADRVDEAEREIQLAIEQTPQPAPSPFYSRMGEVYLRRGDRTTALEWVNRAVEADGQDMWAQFTLAGLLSASGKLNEAAMAARQAVVLSGANVPAAIARRLSEIELGRRNLPEAVEWAQRAVAADPSDVWAQHQLSTVLQHSGDLPGAEVAAEAAVAGGRGAALADFLRRLSEIRREQGRTDEAVALARQAVQSNAKDPWVNLHLARLLLSVTELDGAMLAAKQAIGASQDIKNGIFSRTLSEIYQARKETDRAMVWARKAVLINETDEWSQSHLAGMLLFVGDIDGAERAARLALIHSAPAAMEHFTGIVRHIEARRASSAA